MSTKTKHFSFNENDNFIAKQKETRKAQRCKSLIINEAFVNEDFWQTSFSTSPIISEEFNLSVTKSPPFLIKKEKKMSTILRYFNGGNSVNSNSKLAAKVIRSPSIERNVSKPKSPPLNTSQLEERYSNQNLNTNNINHNINDKIKFGNVSLLKHCPHFIDDDLVDDKVDIKDEQKINEQHPQSDQNDCDEVKKHEITKVMVNVNEKNELNNCEVVNDSSQVINITGKEVNSMTSAEQDVIRELDRSIEEGSNSITKNSLTPVKKREAIVTTPNDLSSIEQEPNNFVEEIYLSSEAKIANSVPYEKKVRASLSSLDSGTSSNIASHFIVVAIDFGTTYSGYAYSFMRDPENVHMMRKWDGGGDPDVHNHKTLTTLLLTPDGEFDSFGLTARETHLNLTTKDAKRWLYFEKFKMSLHHNEYLSKETTLKAMNGRSLSALTVFAHALRYFKQHAIKELTDQCGSQIVDEDIRWVVTVPAIWRQQAKQFMRAAAYEAGMANEQHPERLLIALEPEAASIYCRRMKFNQLLPNRSLASLPTSTDQNLAFDDIFSKGTRYMVVDCGGGTVDITVHEVHDKQGSLKELYKATGGPFGAVGIDIEFEKLLNDIFGMDFIDYYQQKYSSGFVDLMKNFEARKRSATTLQTTPSNISMPFSFVKQFEKYRKQHFEVAVQKYGDEDISYDKKSGILRLQPKVIMSLFDPVIKEIIANINAVLTQANVTNIQYLFLVGGFADSQILQNAIREAFNEKLKVIIPHGVSSAILRGAVLYGIDPSIINIRRSCFTYGIGVLKRFIPDIHPLRKRIDQEGIEWCADIFDKLVLSDQSVAIGETVRRSYTPAKETQRLIVFKIYSSERDDVEFITDDGVRKCGLLVLDLDLPSSDGKKVAINENQRYPREIEVQMTFGNTEINVMAIDVATGQSVKSSINFLSQ